MVEWHRVGFENGSVKVGSFWWDEVWFMWLLKKEEVVEVGVREGYRFLPNKTGWHASLGCRPAHLRLVLVLCMGGRGHGCLVVHHDVVRRVLLTRNR